MGIRFKLRNCDLTTWQEWKASSPTFLYECVVLQEQKVSVPALLQMCVELVCFYKLLLQETKKMVSFKLQQVENRRGKKKRKNF